MTQKQKRHVTQPLEQAGQTVADVAKVAIGAGVGLALVGAVPHLL